jgi:hypothetical protein
MVELLMAVLQMVVPQMAERQTGAQVAAAGLGRIGTR